MKIEPNKKPSTRPTTRRALLAHLWGRGINCNVFKEGGRYAITTFGVIAATHTRRIDAFTFEQWEKRILDIEGVLK